MALLVTLGAAAPEVNANGDKQARPRIDATTYPWHAFGRINREGKGFCTGVLVAPDVVLTAAHCLYHRRTGKWLPARRIHFVAAYQKQTYAFHSRAKSYHVADGFDPTLREPTPSQAVRDWALVSLAKRANHGLGYLGVAQVGRKSRFLSKPALTLAGYGRDRPHALSVDRACRFLNWEGNGRPGLHDCRTARGTSGAPIIGRRNGQYLIYALHVGRTETTAGERGVAVPSQRFFEALRKATGRRATVAADGLAILPGRAGK